MLSFKQLQLMPKTLLARLHDTAIELRFDMSAERIALEHTLTMSYFESREHEYLLRWQLVEMGERFKKSEEWIGRLGAAIAERRTAHQRVMCDEDLWPGSPLEGL